MGHPVDFTAMPQYGGMAMPKYTYDEIKRRLKKLVDIGDEPELSLTMYGKDYMIIGYESWYDFIRCGNRDEVSFFSYNTLDELYNSVTVDNILLSRDWDDITDFHCDSYGWEDDDVLYDEHGRLLWEANGSDKGPVK